MPPNTYASFVFRSFIFVAALLVQDFHHSHLPLCILDEHAPSAAHIFDNIDDFPEARGGAARLGEARETKIGPTAVFENDEEFNDEGDGFDLEIY